MKKEYGEAFTKDISQFKSHSNLINYLSRDSEIVRKIEYDKKIGDRLKEKHEINIFHHINNSTIVTQNVKLYRLIAYQVWNYSNGILKVNLQSDNEKNLEKVCKEIIDAMKIQ